MEHTDSPKFTSIIKQTVDELADRTELKSLLHQHRHDDPLPSPKVLSELIELLREILFPGFFGNSDMNLRNLSYSMGILVQKFSNLLLNQIMAGICFGSSNPEHPLSRSESEVIEEKAQMVTAQIVAYLPEMRRILATDVEATYNGDPAAESFGEIISCYPVIKTLINYRLAHKLLLANVPLIPRIISEMAHSQTGIDIHPGAQIGHHFTIDHGTGVVIGATTIIGNYVRIYQGVTLGVLNFPVDENGNLIKHIPRHPILEDNVIVYSNVAILGRITIGKGAVIGANLCVTEDVPAGTKLKRQ